MSLIEEFRRNTAPGPLYQDHQSFVIPPTPMRLIAYYLPQFYPIPENDAWWGKGFTDWTNITKGTPRFRGHYQPHLPGELGFYDLRMPSVLFRQAELAKCYGIYGFCIHHYWFGGRQFLNEPIRILLDNPDINIHFCLNWANENWTRRWDGAEHEILLKQRHSPMDDVAFARSLEHVFSDPRYIRVDGRPVLMVYQPALLPDARATADRWREHFVRRGFGNPYLVMSNAHNYLDPRKFDFDATAGFPPHGFSRTRILRCLRLTRGFKGYVSSYDEMVRKTLDISSSGFVYMPGVCLGWDNEARRPNQGTVIFGSTPMKYGKWLLESCRRVQALAPSEQLIFINAWNEWAEGTHLEPDRHFGYAYLAETARALIASSQTDAA